MTYRHIICFSLVLTVGACTYVPQTNEGEPGPRAEMSTAESLATAGNLDQAAERYASVATRYPESRFAKEAIWNAALLYSSPSNTAPDDSAAIHWFQVYQALPLAASERQSADACLFYLQRIVFLKTELADKSADVTSRAGRIKDLESQLRQVTEELKKMKELDVKLHLRGGKK